MATFLGFGGTANTVIVDRARVEAALPGYEIGMELGRGGFGLVLAGRHRRLARPVAIKILNVEADADDGALARFAAEAQILANIDHPHVVRVHDYVEAEGLCLIVMEQLPGGTIRIRAGRRRSAEAVARSDWPWPRRSDVHMQLVCCTGTSNPATFSSLRTARRR